ncbi:hypothetical protein [Brevundimonas diminuta]|uniref:Lipoprotein n=1 Tax=Brevundimonas diminuta TaxID=293 RepID=A0A2X1CEF1_BREDI|nr:hypothetical protein [Brevundimonas diminuta]SPU46935.1 Uncharacterised protein [Brevundimonas diminuta]
MPSSKTIAAVCLAAFAVAAALPASAQSLIEIQDVDRDNVIAGTPAAFGVAFPDAQRNEAVREIGEDTYSFVPLAFIPLSDTRVALVSTGANECTGQACSGMNAVHYLDHDAGAPRYPYTLQGEWLDVGAAGVVGNPALRWGWTKAIAANPVLYTEAGGVWQGRGCGYAELTELTPSGPVRIARIQTYFSDASADDGEAGVDGVITAADQGRSFTVSYTGSASFKETYTRGADGQFRLDGQSRVPSC